MHAQRLALIVLDVLGGIAVLASYAHGIATHAEPGRALWGGVPLALRPYYQTSMLTATAGFFAFSWLLVVRLDPATVRVAGRLGFGALVALHALILIPSALWMPLTFRYVDAPSPGQWLAIRIVLGTVGLAALGLVVALATLTPKEPRLAWWVALAGAVAFSIQTTLLDGIVWPALFHRALDR